MSKKEILHHYTEIMPHLESAIEAIEKQLRSSLFDKGLKVHSIDGRVKSEQSLIFKLSRPDRDYSRLFDITDLLAFRIIVYSEDVIQAVAENIENIFSINFANSSNKLVSSDNQKFGYRSLHYVCSLPENLHTPNGDLKNLHFEIQIRTILQHAWAEVEHDLGYKAGPEFSGQFRRRFSQLASLLEIADREFASLRSDILDYQTKLKTTVNSALGSANESISIDQFSIHQITALPEVQHLDQLIADELKKPLSDIEFFPDYLLQALKIVGIENRSQLKDKMQFSDAAFKLFITRYFEFAEQKWSFGEGAFEKVQRGYSLLFVAHLVLLNSESLLIDCVEKLTQFYQQLDHPGQPHLAKQTAEELVNHLVGKSWFQRGKK